MGLMELLKKIEEERVLGLSNLTLGELHSKLSCVDNKDKKVVLSNSDYISNEFGSYRGYYSDIYFESSSKEDDGVNVGEFLELINEALEQGTMVGYKGGDYNIDEDTLVWISSYGVASGLMLVGVAEVDNKVVVMIDEE